MVMLKSNTMSLVYTILLFVTPFALYKYGKKIRKVIAAQTFVVI